MKGSESDRRKTAGHVISRDRSWVMFSVFVLVEISTTVSD